jgi:hypothetical protein
LLYKDPATGRQTNTRADLTRCFARIIQIFKDNGNNNALFQLNINGNNGECSTRSVRCHGTVVSQSANPGSAECVFSLNYSASALMLLERRTRHER